MQSYMVWVLAGLRAGAVPQMVQASAGALAGAALLAGPKFWRAILSVSIAAFSAGFASYALAPKLAVEFAAAVQMGLTAGAAAFLGFAGLQVLLGSLLGGLGAHVLAAPVQLLEDRLLGAVPLWYCFGAAVGAWLLSRRAHLVLSCLLPLLGGFLLAAGLGSLAVQLGIPLCSGGPFLDHARALLGGGGGWTLVCQGLLAMAGAPLRPPAAAVPSAVAVLLGAVASASGLGCWLAHCPWWLQPSSEPLLPLLCGLLWALSTAAATALHLSVADVPEGYEKTATSQPSDFQTLAPSHGHMDAGNRDDPFQTRLPNPGFQMDDDAQLQEALRRSQLDQ